MPESDQEAIVAAISAASLGASFIWEPNPYGKGSGMREPADLAWLCRGTIFLMNMKAGNSTAEKLHRGNMKQLRGWLRMWSSGVPLLGKNPWQTFDLTLEDVDQIVLISIVEAKDATCAVASAPSIHGVDEQKLLLSARLTPRVMLSLAQHAGSAADLADLLLYLASCPGPLDEGRVVEHLREMWEMGRDRALLVSERERDQDLDEITLRSILRVGRMGELDEPPSEAIAETMAETIRLNPEGLAIFNDWDFEITHILLYSVTDMINRVRVPAENEPWQAFSLRQYSLEPYQFLVTAINGFARPETMQSSLAKTFEVIGHLKGQYPDETIFWMGGIVVGPSAHDVQGIMATFGADSPRITSEVLRTAAGLVRQRVATA